MSRRTSIRCSAAGLALVLASGCSFLARDAEQYKADTQAQLDTRRSGIQSCYDRELAQNPNARGKVTVQFVMEKKTGELINPSYDPNRTTVSEAMATCVVGELSNVSIEPDRREGQATWIFEFRPNAKAAAPAEPPAA